MRNHEVKTDIGKCCSFLVEKVNLKLQHEASSSLEEGGKCVGTC